MGENGLKFRIVDRDYNGNALLSVVEEAHNESRFGYIPFSKEKASKILDESLVEEARHLIAVAEFGDEPIGYIFASAGEHYVGVGTLIVTVNTVYVTEIVRKTLLGGKASIGLLRAVARWSKGIGAAEILLHVTSGVEVNRTFKTLTRLGFKSIGGSFAAKVL